MQLQEQIYLLPAVSLLMRSALFRRASKIASFKLKCLSQRGNTQGKGSGPHAALGRTSPFPSIILTSGERKGKLDIAANSYY